MDAESRMDHGVAGAGVARLGRMREVYEKLKGERDSWLKKSAEERAEIEALMLADAEDLAKKGLLVSAKLAHHVMRHAASRMRVLEVEVWNKIGNMTRRLTGKAVVRHTDVELLLTTRCGWSRADVESNKELEKVAAIIFALLPEDGGKDKAGDADKPKQDNFTPPLQKCVIQSTLRIYGRTWKQWKVDHSAALKPNGNKLKNARLIQVNLDHSSMSNNERTLIAALVEKRATSALNDAANKK